MILVLGFRESQLRSKVPVLMIVAALLLVTAPDRTVALTGAEPVTPDSFRFVAYIGDDYGYCTGAIIAPSWVITAAHCVVKEEGHTIKPEEIGDLSRGWPDDDWERVPVKRVISHPHYYFKGDGFRNDVALLELTRPFSSSELVPVEVLGLEAEARYAANGTTATLIGYGEDAHGQRDRDGLFRVLSAPLYHADACRAEHSFVDRRGEIVHEGTICAGDRERGIRSGDSGGPLLVETEDGAYGLIGIASISGHDPSGHPVVAVYARVATVKDWIDGCVHGTGECVEGGVRVADLKPHVPDENRRSETLEQRPTAVIFVNETGQVFSYHWIDFNGAERFYGAVSPGESTSQHTYPGHVWEIKDADGQTLAVFVAEPETGRATVTADMLAAAVDIDAAQVDVSAVDVDDQGASGWARLPDADFPFTIHFDPSSNLDTEVTPWTWGGYPQGTQNRAGPYDGVWAVYEEADGTVVQVSVWGSASDPPESGAGWRLRTASGWGEWNVGTGRYRIKTSGRLPRFTGPLDAEPGSVAMIVQAAQLKVPFLNQEEPHISESEWRLSWLLMIHDEAAGTQTVLQCWYGCRAWQRESDFMVAAVENGLSVHDDRAIDTEADVVPDLSRDRVSVVLDEALSATTWNVHGDEVPDWPTRLRALELAIEVAGTPTDTDASVAAAGADGLPNNLRWEPSTGGDVPPSAVPGGFESYGEVLYICRAEIEGGLHPGKVSQILRACVVPYAEREHFIGSYEVLVVLPTDGQ